MGAATIFPKGGGELVVQGGAAVKIAYELNAHTASGHFAYHVTALRIEAALNTKTRSMGRAYTSTLATSYPRLFAPPERLNNIICGVWPPLLYTYLRS
jgi:hypothetical protein